MSSVTRPLDISFAFHKNITKKAWGLQKKIQKQKKESLFIFWKKWRNFAIS